jgi:hypothetical protein
MANTYKNIVITPNIGNTADPKIVFSGGNTTVNTDISLFVYPDSNGTISFEGSAGQLFSVTNDLSNLIFSVADVSGIPSLEVYANSLVSIAPFGGNVVFGNTAELILSPGAGIYANGGLGTAGQLLASNGTSVYWVSPTGVDVNAQYVWTNTQTFSNTITFSQTIIGTANNASNLNGKAEAALNVNSALNANNSTNLGGVAAAGYQTTAGLSANVATLTSNNATNAFGKTEAALNVNSALTANNSTNLGGQAAAFYTNATNITTGTLPYAQIPANIINTTAAFTRTGITTFSANVVLGSSGLSANGSFGTATHVLHSNGTAAYWAADDQGVTSVATGNGMTGGTITATGTVSVLANAGIVANATGVFVLANTGIVTNTTGVFVNSTYIGTLTANNANNLGGTAASGYQTTAGLSANVATLTANNANNLGGQLPAYYTNATNITTGTLPYAQIPANIINTTAAFTRTGITTFSANVVLGSSGLSANGSFGTATHVLHSNGTATYWAADDQGVTSVATGNGLTGGTITTTGTLSVLANTGIVANATGVYVNATYIGTLTSNNATNAFGKTEGNLNVNNATTAYSKAEGALNVNSALTANNSTNLGGVAAASYVQNTDSRTLSGNLVFSGANVTSSGNLRISGGLIANGLLGTAGHTLHSNGTAVYWATDDNTDTTYDLLPVANGVANEGIIRLKDSANANDDVKIVGANGIVVSSNSTAILVTGQLGDVTGVTAGNGLTGGGTSGDLTLNVGAGTGIVVGADDVSVNASYIATISANNASFLNGKSEANLNVNNATTAYGKTEGALNVNSALTANNSTNLGGTAAAGYQTTAGLSANVATLTANNSNNLGGQLPAYYTNATNITTGTLPYAQIPANIINTTAAFTRTGITTFSANVVLGSSGLSSNGGFGTAGQLLTSNGTATYWSTPAAASVNVNAQYVWTNTQTFSNTITFSSIINGTANNANNLGGQLPAFYTNATNITTGTLPYAQIPANVINTTAAFTRTGITTFSANVVLGSSGLSANGIFGTAGQVLHSNGTATYWAADDNSGTVTSVATGNGMTGGTISTTGTVSVLANTGIVANATGTFVNASYIATITANNATFINGNNALTVMESLRANRSLHGGGTITVDGSGNVLWSARYIVISNGRGTHFSTGGYFDIDCPVSGTITGAGGASNKTATAAGIPLAAWEALYYILPIGSTSTSVAANFRVVNYTSDVEIPSNWLLICAQNSDNGNYYFNNGIILKAGQSFAGVLFTSANMPLANNASNLNGKTEGALSVNNATFAFGKTEGALNVNSALTANNSTNLGGQLPAYYTNATNITTGTLPYAQIPANVINTTAAFTRTGITTFSANVVLGSSGMSSNGSFGTATHVLHSNGTATYWAAATVAASYVQNTDSRVLSGNLNFTGTNNFFSTGLFVGANVIANTTALFVGNSTANSTTNATAVIAHIQHASRPTLGFNYTVSNTVNSLIVGPYTVNTGFTLTVETGARLVIA